MKKAVDAIALGACLVGLAATGVGLLVWATYKTVQVGALRLAGRHGQAARVQRAADRDLRVLHGMPEPGEGWD